MVRYVAIPRTRRRDVAPESMILPLDNAARAELIERATRANRRDRSLAPTVSMEAHFANKPGAAIIADPRGQTSLTGVTVIEGDADDAAVLQQELPDHEVFEDFEIHMVEPVAAEAADDAPELWHLMAIGLIGARARGFAGRGDGKVIAILDTGIAKVPELGTRIAGAWEVSGTMQTAEIETHDTDGHGTGVASVAAGATVGIAPAAEVLNVLMMPFRRAMYVDFLTAMEFTARRPNVLVANISAGLVAGTCACCRGSTRSCTREFFRSSPSGTMERTSPAARETFPRSSRSVPRHETVRSGRVAGTKPSPMAALSTRSRASSRRART